MAQNLSVSKQAPPPGILELVAEGMSHVVVRPWLLAIPVALDALLVLSPRFSGLDISQRFGNRLVDSDLRAIADLGDWSLRQGAWGIERSLVALMPSVVDGPERDQVYQPFSRGTVDLGLFAGLALVVVGLLIGALLFMTYETVLARAMGLLEPGPSRVGSVVRNGLSYVAVWLMAVAVLAVVTTALLAPSAIADREGLSRSAVISVLSLASLIMLVATMFVPEAIVLGDLGPIRAIAASARVVRDHFWQAILFFLSQLFLAPGLFSIWESIAHRPDGLILAILLNAGMTTSVALASLGFFQAREPRAA